MKAGIITIGDELLIGQTINTNTAFIGKTLSKIGVNIWRSVIIKDDVDAIINCVDYYIKNVDLIFITGGLGPTNDDLTKEALSSYFKTELVFNEQVLSHIKRTFDAKGKEMLSSNRQQAMLPKDAKILYNPFGTAPGMWFEKDDKTVISMPGVPYEMEALLINEIVPKLRSIFNLKGQYYQTIILQGIEESFLAKEIENWENRIYKDGLHLAYLPSPGLIRLRLTAKNGKQDASKISDYFEELKLSLPQYIYGQNNDSIFNVTGNILKDRHQTLGTIESCTGGGIANSFIAFPGASDFFKGGLITYSNELKIKLASVSPSTLEKYGAVSKQVAEEMAIGGKSKLNVDYSIAVTGIAGPDGGTKYKPVGSVWIAVATPKKIITKHFLFGENRERNLIKTQLSAVNLLRNIILEIKVR